MHRQRRWRRLLSKPHGAHGTPCRKAADAVTRSEQGRRPRRAIRCDALLNVLRVLPAALCIMRLPGWPLLHYGGSRFGRARDGRHSRRARDWRCRKFAWKADNGASLASAAIGSAVCFSASASIAVTATAVAIATTLSSSATLETSAVSWAVGAAASIAISAPALAATTVAATATEAVTAADASRETGLGLREQRHPGAYDNV